MAMTDEELTRLRSYVTWTPPEDATLNLRFEALGSWPAVALEAVRTKRNQLLSNPSSFTVPGEYGESWGDNMRYLSEALKELEGLVPADPDGGGGTGLVVGRMVRADRPYGSR